MMEAANRNHKARFGEFEADLRSGELRKHGIRLKLQDQPFQVLALLLEHPGELVTREELHQKLWAADTFVDFDTGLNSAIKKLRGALNDSPDEPRYIETVPRHGYRFIASVAVENGARPALEAVESPDGSPIFRSPPEPATKPANRRRAMAAAALAILLLAAALVAWRVYFARPGLSGTDVILLANFVNKTGDPIFDDSLDKALQIKLTESPFLSLFSESDTRAAMRMMRRDAAERVSPELAVEICKRQGLKAVVVPEIAAFGNTYVITLDAIDARTLKSIARRQEVAPSKELVVAALGKAGSQLRRQLGESLSSLEKHDAPLDQATTSSLEALQAYRAGLAPYRSGKTQEAIPFFERAVELDPNFCLAYDMLGGAYHGVGNDQASRKAFARAFELKDGRLTQEENFLITATYYWNITGNLDKEYAVLVLYQQTYPRSVNAANLLGINYLERGKHEEGLQQFKWAIEHSPVPAVYYYTNASQALMNLGRLDEARKLIEEWQTKGSLFSYQIDMLYRIAFFQNDTATMERLTRDAAPDDTGWLGLQMQFAFLRGDLGIFRSMSDTSINLQTHSGQTENATDETASRAQLESFIGNYAVARNLCRHAGEGDKSSATTLWRCAEALAYAGDVTQAETLAAKLDRMYPEDTIQQNVFLPIIHSVIERQRGNPAKAADLLARAEPYDFSLDVNYQRGLAYLAAGDAAKAIEEFQKLLSQRGAGWWQTYAPLAQLGIARAYAMQGESEQSRKAYDEFFATWKNADSNISILHQAKAEYNKLTATESANAPTAEKKR